MMIQDDDKKEEGKDGDDKADEVLPFCDDMKKDGDKKEEKKKDEKAVC